MRRFAMMLANELKLARATIPIHLIALFQPSLMFLLMSLVLVTPTFQMAVVEPHTAEGQQLVTAMSQVASPAGIHYIEPVIVTGPDDSPFGQVITSENRDGRTTVTQHFGMIDSNLLKNYRNRLTAAALVMWEDSLGSQAITMIEYPWLPEDVPYAVYFGMAMLPLTTFLAAALIGGFATAREFETDTMLEYRLSPAPLSTILAARLGRLVLVGWTAAAILLLVVGFTTAAWPEAIWPIPLILLPIALTGGCLGLTTAMILKSSLPTFLICLAASFVTWLLGAAFGLPTGFSGTYETVSRLMPNTYAVSLLFPLYYDRPVSSAVVSFSVLAAISTVMLLLTALVYRRQITAVQDG